MARKYLKKDTYRTLFAKTGNQCAFPNCTHPLVDDDGDFIAQICHIEAAEPGGQRFNPATLDDERRSASNLLVLCYRHHIKTNDVKTYTVEVLRKMKADHEALWRERPFSLSDSVIEKIIEDELSYWTDVELINSDWIEDFDLAMPVPTTRDPFVHLAGVSENVAWLESLLGDLQKIHESLAGDISKYLSSLGYDTKQFDEVKYYQNPFHGVEWLRLNIGCPNAFTKIRIFALLIEIHLGYQALKASPGDQRIASKLDDAKKQLKEIAGSAGYVD